MQTSTAIAKEKEERGTEGALVGTDIIKQGVLVHLDKILVLPENHKFLKSNPHVKMLFKKLRGAVENAK